MVKIAPGHWANDDPRDTPVAGSELDQLTLDMDRVIFATETDQRSPIQTGLFVPESGKSNMTVGGDVLHEH